PAIEQHGVGDFMSGYELADSGLIIGGIGDREDRHPVAILLLDRRQRRGERGAVRTRALHELEHHGLAAVIVEIVEAELGIHQCEPRRAARNVGGAEGEGAEECGEYGSHAVSTSWWHNHRGLGWEIRLCSF